MPTSTVPPTTRPSRTTGSRRFDRSDHSTHARISGAYKYVENQGLLLYMKNQPDRPYTLPAATAASGTSASIRAAQYAPRPSSTNASSVVRSAVVGVGWACTTTESGSNAAVGGSPANGAPMPS